MRLKWLRILWTILFGIKILAGLFTFILTKGEKGHLYLENILAIVTVWLL